MEITIQKQVLQANEDLAQQVQERLRAHHIVMVNLIGSPGAGKTTLLKQTLDHFKSRFSMAVIEADVATTRDAEMLQSCDVPIVSVNTSGACHLESVSVNNALDTLDLGSLDLIFIENVGNLVCPAEFNVGEAAKIALLSTPEGADKPCKYPLLFREASLLLVTKTDLAPYVAFNREVLGNDIRQLNGQLPVLEVSASTMDGMTAWFNWLEDLYQIRST